MRQPVRVDMERPILNSRPLVGELEAIDGSRSELPDESQNSSRDEGIINQLRNKLAARPQGNVNATGGRRASDKRLTSEEDKYEPQRLSRKICWQYDQSAHKVPLLRRHYI